MLRTVEATFDPSTGVHFTEPVTIEKPVRILVTFMDTVEKNHISATSKNSLALQEWLNLAPTPSSVRTPEEIELYIHELRTSWE